MARTGSDRTFIGRVGALVLLAAILSLILSPLNARFTQTYALGAEAASIVSDVSACDGLQNGFMPGLDWSEHEHQVEAVLAPRRKARCAFPAQTAVSEGILPAGIDSRAQPRPPRTV